MYSRQFESWILRWTCVISQTIKMMWYHIASAKFSRASCEYSGMAKRRFSSITLRRSLRTRYASHASHFDIASHVSIRRVCSTHTPIRRSRYPIQWTAVCLDTELPCVQLVCVASRFPMRLSKANAVSVYFFFFLALSTGSDLSGSSMALPVSAAL